MKKIKSGLVAGGVVLAGVGTSAHAAIDLTAITGAVTAADVTVGVLAIAGVLATVYATIKAAKIALGMLRGA